VGFVLARQAEVGGLPAAAHGAGEHVPRASVPRLEGGAGEDAFDRPGSGVLPAAWALGASAKYTVESTMPTDIARLIEVCSFVVGMRTSSCRGSVSSPVSPFSSLPNTSAVVSCSA